MENFETLEDRKNRIAKDIMEGIEVMGSVSDERLLELIDREIIEETRKNWIPLSDRILLRVNLFNSLRKLDILQDFLDDPDITEIMVNGFDCIFLEKHGVLYRSEKSFSSAEKLQDVIQQIVSRVNRTVNAAHPIVDARLEDGSRVNVVLDSIALNGPILTIRKFGQTGLSLEELVERDMLTENAASYLKTAVKDKKNIFISGGTGTGKTTFLNALSAFIPEDERVVTIEDSAELQLQNIPNLVRLEARRASGEGEEEVTIRDLIRTALRMRPDRIIVGEVRDGACLDMLQAFNTGHEGSLSTGHGNSSQEMLARLETLAMMGAEKLPLEAIREQIGSAIDIIVHLRKKRSGEREVFSVTEVYRYDKEEREYRWKTLYYRNTEGLLVDYWNGFDP